MEHKFKGQVLELQTSEKTEHNDTTGVDKVVATYYQLHGFEFGRKYPEVVRIKLRQPQVANALLLVGKHCEITLDEFKGTSNGKEYTNYNFVSGMELK